MEKKRTITITRETHELLVIRGRSGRPTRAWCVACAAEVEMLTPDEAAPLTGTPARSIYRRAESGQLHFMETPAGHLLICLDSLLRAGLPPTTIK